MKINKSKPIEKNRNVTPQLKDATSDSKVDELGIQRGQNGEKGNTVNQRNVRPAKEAAH